MKISAKSGEGIERLLSVISDNLPDKMKKLSLLIPYSDGSLASRLHTFGKVLSEEYREDGIMVTALVDKLHISECEKFIIG